MATSKSTTATGTGFKLSVMTLAIMNVTAVVSLRGLPSEAVYGPSSAFYYLFAAIVFLIPTALVAAELAAMFSDKQGGVFRWVGEAMGAPDGLSRYLAPVDREHDLVSDRADVRGRGDRLYRYSSAARHDAGLEQDFHADRRARHLLAGYVHRAEGTDVGRQDFQNRGYDRNDHSRPVC